MSNFNATSYRGYSCVIGQIDLCQFFKQLSGTLYRKKIQEIEAAIQEGDFTKADYLKRQLPYYTITANYDKCRLPYSLSAYNDLPVLDFDDMSFDDIPRLRRLAEEDPATIGCALSPRRHGLKLVVCLQTEDATRLRNAFQARGTVTYAELERYHKQMFELTATYYERLLDSKVDPSGSDLSRGMYATYDPDAFFSEERLAQVPPLDIEIQIPTQEEYQSRKQKKGRPKSTGNAPFATNQPEDSSLTDGSQASESATSAPAFPAPTDVDPLSQLEYRKAVDYTRRKFRFEPNSRDSFIYCLGTQCYSRHIAEEDALRMVLHDYGSHPDFNAETPLRNAYLYTTKTDACEEEQKKPMMQKIVDYLSTHYEFRRNTVRDSLEFRPYVNSPAPLQFDTMRAKDNNTIYTQMQLSSIFCTLPMVKAVIDSDYAKEYDPFVDYFLSLKPWDGVTDYIGQLAATVEADDQAFWEDSLRRWLVGLVACAIDEEKQNHEMLLLYSKQGKGKSTFIRNLMPPPLKKYYRNGMIKTDYKDHMLLLSSCLIINLEEFDGVSNDRLADLKRIITQELITERKVWEPQTLTYVRRASFAASTNNPRCLVDLENRRILLNSITSIDYHTPVNHEGIYSQAVALLQQGFPYWYEGEEINMLNARNENFRQKSPVEEILFFYFRMAKPRDIDAKWYPASHILSILSLNGRIQTTQQTQQILISVLEENNFPKRTTKQGMTEYWVVSYNQEEMNENAVLPQLPEQQNLEM